MTAEFSLIEYSYNANYTSASDVIFDLSMLGYQIKTEHVNGNVLLWNQNLSIILVRETTDIIEAGVTGLGFIATDDAIENLDYTYDEETDMLLAHDPNGMRILIIPETEFSRKPEEGILQLKYRAVEPTEVPGPGFNVTVGLRYNCSEERTIAFYETLGFKRARTTDEYIFLLSNNNMFSLMLNRFEDDKRITTMVCDTNDVFAATAYCAANRLRLAEFDIDPETLDFGKMNHKITGYGCVAFGNENSYSIENVLCDPVRNLDIVFRTRKQYFNISEFTLQGSFCDVT